MDVLFFAVAKGVWTFIRPETLLLLLIAGGVWITSRGSRFGVSLSVTGLVLCLVIGIVPFGAYMLRSLEARFPAQPELSAPPLGILVLGGGEELSPPGAPPQTNAAGERYMEALVLAERFPDAVVMFTGGSAAFDSDSGGNAEHAAWLWTRAGLDPDRIILEGASRNTAENASRGLSLIPEGTEAGPWLLVTSAWHMPRAVATFCAAGWRGIVPWPVDFRHGQTSLRWRFAQKLELLNTASKEWVGLLGYRATGRTKTLWPEGCPPG